MRQLLGAATDIVGLSARSARSANQRNWDSRGKIMRSRPPADPPRSTATRPTAPPGSSRMPRYRERRRREQMLPEGLTDSDRELHAPHHRRVAEDRGTLARIFFDSEKYHSPLGFVRPESEVKGESAVPTKSQGPNWLRITS